MRGEIPRDRHGSVAVERAIPEGHTIVSRFVDASTGRVVVEHVAPEDRRTRMTVIDPGTGEVVPIARRAAEIGHGQVVRVDEARGLRLSYRRTIDPVTGYEARDGEVLTDIRSGAVLARGSSCALAPGVTSPDLLDRHLAHLEILAQERAFWRDEYPRWSFERRAEHWYDRIRRHMRSHEELGLNELAGFTPESYETWRALDPDIDRILEVVATRLGRSLASLTAPLGRPAPRRARRRR